MTLKKTLMAAVMTMLAACSNATGRDYQGEPLFTVKGQMALGGSASAPVGPIRLAVAT